MSEKNTRNRYTAEQKADVVDQLDGDYSQSNLTKIAEENDIKVQNIRNWAIAAGKITPNARKSVTAAPKLITSVMLAQFADKMKPHLQLEEELIALHEAVAKKEAELEALRLKQAEKDSELLAVQLEIQKEIGMI